MWGIQTVVFPDIGVGLALDIQVAALISGKSGLPEFL
jgi:hypothetical protein